MATIYVDLIDGNDANDGTTWALAKKSLDIQTTYSGDNTIKVAKTPDPVALGNFKFQKADFANMTPGYVESIRTLTSSSNTTPVRITHPAHTFVTGDFVSIYNHTDATGINGQWEIEVISSTQFDLIGSVGVTTGTGGTAYRVNSKCLKVNSCSEYKFIEDASTLWTVANTSTISLITTSPARIDGAKMLQITKTSVANSTKYAYKTIPELNLSAFQQISFFFMAGNSSYTDDRFEICLCSDTDGNVVVDRFALPKPRNTSAFNSFVLSKIGGGNLGSSIKSIALYSSASSAYTGTWSLKFRNFVATKLNGFNHNTPMTLSSSPTQVTTPQFLPGVMSDRMIQIWQSCETEWVTVSSISTLATGNHDVYYVPVKMQENPQTEYIYRIGGSSPYNLSIIGGYNKTTDIIDGVTALTAIGTQSRQFLMSTVATSCVMTMENFSLFRGNESFSGTVGLNGIFNLKLNHISGAVSYAIYLFTTPVGPKTINVEVGYSCYPGLLTSNFPLAVTPINFVSGSTNLDSDPETTSILIKTSSNSSTGFSWNSNFCPSITINNIRDCYVALILYGLSGSNKFKIDNVENCFNLLLLQYSFNNYIEFGNTQSRQINAYGGSGSFAYDNHIRFTGTVTASTFNEIMGTGVIHSGQKFEFDEVPSITSANSYSNMQNYTFIRPNIDLVKSCGGSIGNICDINYIDVEGISGDIIKARGRIGSTATPSLGNKIESDKIVIRDTEDFSWKMTTSDLFQFDIAKIACKASTPISIKIFYRILDTTKTLLTFNLKNWRDSGLTTQPSVTLSAVANTTWYSQTLTFTPTKDFVAELEVVNKPLVLNQTSTAWISGIEVT